MKRLVTLVLTFAFMLLLSSCRNTDALNSAPTKSVVVDDSLVLVQSNHEFSKPYENFIWAQQWTEHGWLSADASSISHSFSEICNDIPQITYCNDFEIHYKNGVEFLSLSVYNSDFDRIHHNVNEAVLSDLADGTYYLVIKVKSQGKYVEAAEKYEYSGYECAYKLIIAG